MIMTKIIQKIYKILLYPSTLPLKMDLIKLLKVFTNKLKETSLLTFLFLIS